MQLGLVITKKYNKIGAPDIKLPTHYDGVLWRWQINSLSCAHTNI